MTNIKHVNSVVDREFRNRINQLIDSINAQGKSIQDLIAEGQLTVEQYAELITVINGLIKSGHVDKSDLTPEFKDEIEVFSTQLSQKATKEEVRLKSVKVELEDASEEFLSAMSGNASFSLKSVPQNKSVTLNKLSDGVMDVISTNKNGSGYVWEIGSISDNFGYNTTDGKKIRTDYIKVSKGTVVTNLDPNNHLRCFKYHRPTNAEFFGYEEVTSSIEVEKDCYIKLRSGYNPPVDLSEGDKVNLANKVSLDIIISFKNEIEEVKEMSRTFKKTLSWVLGTVNTSYYHQIPSTNRIVTPDYIKVLKGTTVLLSDVENHMYAINKFTSDHHTTHFEDTGWLDSERYVIDEDCYIKILVRDKANGDISDVNLYGSVISLNIPISTKFDYVDEILGNTQTAYKNTLDAFVKGVAHRGYSTEAPENTLPAYTLAKEKGFAYVEADIEWTSDGIPVLLHDSTINRTSNGTGNINDMSLAEVRDFDFGSWKNSIYAGTKIPTFEEFILLCKKLSLHPYIETKGIIDSTKAEVLVNIVKKLGMIKNVTWISFTTSNLNEILNIVPKARVGRVSNTLDQGIITVVENLKTDVNDVFLDINHNNVTNEMAQLSLISDIPIEVWTVNDSGLVNDLIKKGVSGITTDGLNIAEILSN